MAVGVLRTTNEEGHVREGLVTNAVLVPAIDSLDTETNLRRPSEAISSSSEHSPKAAGSVIKEDTDRVPEDRQS
jgi:hypothetical protein